MELQIPHSIRTEVQKACDIRADKERNREDAADPVRKEGHSHTGGGSLPRPYTYVGYERVCVGSSMYRHIGNDRLLEQQSGEEGAVAVSIQAPPALQVTSPYRAGTNHRLAGGLDLGSFFPTVAIEKFPVETKKQTNSLCHIN